MFKYMILSSHHQLGVRRPRTFLCLHSQIKPQEVTDFVDAKEKQKDMTLAASKEEGEQVVVCVCRRRRDEYHIYSYIS